MKIECSGLQPRTTCHRGWGRCSLRWCHAFCWWDGPSHSVKEVAATTARRRTSSTALTADSSPHRGSTHTPTAGTRWLTNRCPSNQIAQTNWRPPLNCDLRRTAVIRPPSLDNLFITVLPSFSSLFPHFIRVWTSVSNLLFEIQLLIRFHLKIVG